MIINTLALIFASTSYLSLWKTHFWWVRVLDFPRLQLTVINMLFLSLRMSLGVNTLWDAAVSILLMIALGLDAYRMKPYSVFSRVECPKLKDPKLKEQSIKALSFNVKQVSTSYKRALDGILEQEPDLILLMETNKNWQENLKDLRTHYPYRVEVPQENTYGMLFYSKLPIESHEVKYMVDENVPTLFLKLKDPAGKTIEVIALHPRPPRPSEGHSTQRDSELSIVARYIKEHKKRPILVIGDFNDVAWSHTTRLFKRVSQILDPRVGRGLYCSFPVAYPFLRFPVDHTFFTKHIGFIDLKRLKDVGSDHFPILLEVTLLNQKKGEPNEAPDSEDFKENKQYIKDGKKWEPPKKEIKD